MLAAKGVDLVLVSYADDRGDEVAQLAVVGDNNVYLLDVLAKRAPKGEAAKWLREGTFEKLGRKKK